VAYWYSSLAALPRCGIGSDRNADRRTVFHTVHHIRHNTAFYYDTYGATERHRWRLVPASSEPELADIILCVRDQREAPRRFDVPPQTTCHATGSGAVPLSALHKPDAQPGQQWKQYEDQQKCDQRRALIVGPASHEFISQMSPVPGTVAKLLMDCDDTGGITDVVSACPPLRSTIRSP